MTEEDIQGQTLVFTHICVRMHNQIEEQQKKVEEERGGKRERRIEWKKASPSQGSAAGIPAPKYTQATVNIMGQLSSKD